MTRCDRRLQSVRPERAAEFFRTLESHQSAAHENAIPSRAILIEQWDRFARRSDARLESRCLNLHERDEAVHFRLVRNELAEDASEPESLFAERRPQQIIAGRRRVTFIEDEINDFEH